MPMKSSFQGLVGLLLVALVGVTACGGDDDSNPTGGDTDAEGESVADIDTETPMSGDADEVEAQGDDDGEEIEEEAEAEESLPWRALVEGGDDSGDCATTDAACEADILALEYYRNGDLLTCRVLLANGLPEGGSYELFLIPGDTSIVGHTVRFNDGVLSYWNADCTSARKHAGCHWSIATIPDSLSTSMDYDGNLYVEVKLSDLGFGNLASVLAGVAVAPFTISLTTEFTDRYPDGLWVSSTDVQGLANLWLEEE